MPVFGDQMDYLILAFGVHQNPEVRGTTPRVVK
jgi:hypothetical protein